MSTAAASKRSCAPTAAVPRPRRGRRCNQSNDLKPRTTRRRTHPSAPPPFLAATPPLRHQAWNCPLGISAISALGFLYARANVPEPKTVQNLRMRLVRVDRVEVGMAGQNAPSELFPDVVDAGLWVDLD